MGDPFGSILAQNYGLKAQQGKPVPMSSARGKGGGGPVGSSGVGAANGRSGGVFGGGSSAMAGSSYAGATSGGSRASGFMSGTPMRGGSRGGGLSSLGGAQDDVFASLNNGGSSSGRSSPNNNDVFATLGNLSSGTSGVSGYGATKTPPMRPAASGSGDGGGKSLGADLDDMLESISRKGGGGGGGGGGEGARGGARKASASSAAYGIDDLFGTGPGSSSNSKVNSSGDSSDDLFWGIGGGRVGKGATSSGEKVGGRSPSHPTSSAGGAADDVADLLGGFGNSEASAGVPSKASTNTKSSPARTEDKGDPLVSLDGDTDSGGGKEGSSGFATPATEFDDPFEGLTVPRPSGSPPSSAPATGADGAPRGAAEAASGHPSRAPSATGIEGFEDFAPPTTQPASSSAEAAGPRGTGGAAAAGRGGNDSMPAQSRQAGVSGDRGVEGEEDGPNPTVSGVNVDSASASIPPSGAATAAAATAAERRTPPEEGAAPGSKEVPRPARDERPPSAPSQGQPPTAGGRDTSPMPNAADGQRGPGAAAPPASARAAGKDAPAGREKMKPAETRSGVPPPVATNMGTADSGRGGGFGFPEEPAPSVSPTFKEWVTIKDIKLKTRPCTLPPPSRPPPPVPPSMGFQRASPVFSSNPSLSPNHQRPADPVVRLRSSMSADTQQSQPPPEEPRLRKPHAYEPTPVFPRASTPSGGGKTARAQQQPQQQQASAQPPPRYDSPSSTGAGRPRWGPGQQDGSGGGGASARASASSAPSSSSSNSKEDARGGGESEDPYVAQIRRMRTAAPSSAQSSPVPERTSSGKEEDAARAAAAQSSAEVARAAKKAQEKMRAEMAAKEEAASRQPRPSPSPSPSPAEQRASDSGNFFGQSTTAGRGTRSKPRPTERDFMGAGDRPPMTSVDDLANLGKKKKQPGGWVDMSAEDMWGPDVVGSAAKVAEPEDPNEPAERRAYRSERDRRVEERAAEALAEKNRRDMEMLREQEARHLADEELGGEIKRWAANKEGNIRALLSTLQDVLWPGCGWVPVSITDLISAAAVKKYYRKAALCVHPDKVQQKGATVRQKYVAEKVFDLLKEAWNKFNSEELF